MTLNESSATLSTTTSHLLDEISAWRPRERAGEFRHWQRGSLSLVHLQVVSLLEEGALPMSRLAESLDVSVASATGIVDRMEDRHLVERQRDDHDRRLVLVNLTPAGRSVFHDIADQRRTHLAVLIERMAEKERVSLLTGLRALRREREASGR